MTPGAARAVFAGSLLLGLADLAWLDGALLPRFTQERASASDVEPAGASLDGARPAGQRAAPPATGIAATREAAAPVGPAASGATSSASVEQTADAGPERPAPTVAALLLARPDEAEPAAEPAATTEQALVEPLLFQHRSTLLLPEHEARLDAIAQRLLLDRRLQLQLEGHTDSAGGAAENLALGWERARTVAGALRARGVPRSSLLLDSIGEGEPIERGRGDHPRNRRVELHWLP